MTEEWTFTQKEMNKRARFAYNNKMSSLYIEQQNKIFTAVDNGEFSIIFQRDQVDERYLYWLQSFNFNVYVRQIPKPWTEWRDGYDLKPFDEVQIRW